MGRKKMKGREKFRGLRCSDEIWAQFVAASKKYDVPISEILREGGLDYIKRLERKHK